MWTAIIVYMLSNILDNLPGNILQSVNNGMINCCCILLL